MPTVMPTLMPSTQAPTINCARNGVDLSTFVAAEDGIQTCFTATDANYIYSFTVPVCGIPPAYCSSFGPQDIGQIGSQSGFNNYNLGTYSESWSLTSFESTPALSVNYTEGDYCSGVGDRNTTLFVLCDRSLHFPTALISETTNCSYEIVVSTSDANVCSSLMPRNTNMNILILSL